MDFYKDISRLRYWDWCILQRQAYSLAVMSNPSKFQVQVQDSPSSALMTRYSR